MTKEQKNRLAEEAERLAKMKERAMKPEGVGPEIVEMAPARGPVRRFQPREALITASGSIRVSRSGHMGYDALQIADAFDVMEQQAKRRSGDAAALFSAGQVSAGRDYAALFERCQTAGVRCSSIEAMGSGGDGSFIDAVIRDSRRLAALHRAIGSAVVLSPRGEKAHSDRGRRVLSTHDLVFCVCVEGLTISQLLQKFGWSVNAHYRNKTRAALCAALDRMQGFRDRPENDL